MPSQTDKKPTRTQDERVRSTRAAVYRAIITSLDEVGYAGTTFTTVQKRAGMSRGALTYHFDSKLDMMVFAASRLLEAAIRPTQTSGGRRAASTGNIADFLMFHWRHIVNTSEGRAFVEILIACRTDEALNGALSDTFEAWDAAISQSAMENFVAASGSEEDAALLWSMSRTFVRGLLIHARFERDPVRLEEMLSRFGQMLADELTMRAMPK